MIYFQLVRGGPEHLSRRYQRSHQRWPKQIRAAAEYTSFIRRFQLHYGDLPAVLSRPCLGERKGWIKGRAYHARRDCSRHDNPWRCDWMPLYRRLGHFLKNRRLRSSIIAGTAHFLPPYILFLYYLILLIVYNLFMFSAYYLYSLCPRNRSFTDRAKSIYNPAISVLLLLHCNTIRTVASRAWFETRIRASQTSRPIYTFFTLAVSLLSPIYLSGYQIHHLKTFLTAKINIYRTYPLWKIGSIFFRFPFERMFDSVGNVLPARREPHADGQRSDFRRKNCGAEC